MKIAYLFRIRLWQYDPAEFILVYGEDEVDAREKGAKQLVYNSGEQVNPIDFKLVTYF